MKVVYMAKLVKSPQMLISLFGFIMLNIAIMSSAYLCSLQLNTIFWALSISISITLLSYFIVKYIIRISVIEPMIRSERRSQSFRDIIENSLNEIFIFDKESLHFTYINRGARLNTGYSLSEMKKMTPLDIKPEFTKERFLQTISPLLKGEKEQITIETTHRRKDGTDYDVDIRLQLMDVDGEEKFVAIINDITERNQALKAKEKFFKISIHDYLTKIYNRKRFDELYKQEFERAIRYGVSLSLVLFDIDDFKQINDNCGHNVGDTVLQGLADYVRKNLRDSDIFARWGGEEFVILMPHADLDLAKQKSEQLRVGIEALSFVDANSVTCSFGVVEVLKDDTIITAFKRADEALYQAKHAGKNTVRSI